MRNATLKIIGILLLGASAITQDFSGITPALSDPTIPDGEEIRYSNSTGDQVSYSVLRVNHSVNEAGEAVYLVVNSDEEIDRTVTITRGGLIPLQSLSTSRINGSTYESQTRVLRTPEVGSEEVFILGVSDLNFVLRGYPFDNPRRLSLHILGQDSGDSGFALEVVYRRRESLEIQGREYQAHKLELVTRLPGAMAIFRGAIPKTFLWYNAEAPHQLLRYQGAAGFGNDAELVTEMVSYRRISRN